MPNSQLDQLPLSACESLAGVPYLDQYVGAWALFEAHARVLLGQAENINVQLHLEQHVPAAAAAVATSAPLSDVQVTRDGIAIVELRGTLMKHASSFSAGTSTVRARRQIRAAAASDDVAGILLVIDSPGGTVAGTMDLAQDLARAGSKKPLFAHIEDLGASAAYWQAAQAHRVSAGASALVGSIGVFSVVYDFSKMAEADGVKVHVVRFGEFKGAGTPGTQITDEQLARWQRIVDAHGDDFVSAVAAGRKLSASKARELANGDIHKGEAAKALGLVDAIESLDDTLAALVAETKKPRSSLRTKAMSEQLAAVATELKTSAATLAELKEACPGATSDFLLDQLEKSATVATAMKAHAKQLAETNAKLAKERDEAKAAAETAAAEKAKTAPAGKKRGTDPIGGAGSDEDAAAQQWEGLTANEFMQLKIDERVGKGMKRDKAAKSVFAAHPGLREAVVAEANEGRRAA